MMQSTAHWLYSMPSTREQRMQMLRTLRGIYDKLAEKHYQCAPRGGSLPIGGGDWMDCFFRMEGIRGMMQGLRNNKSLVQSLQDGKDASTVAVKAWNGKREWQVHRWEQTAWHFLECTIKDLSPREKTCQN